MKLETDTMTAVERVLACANHEEPDRLPIYLMAIPEYSQTIKDLKEVPGVWDDFVGNPDNRIDAPLKFLAEKPDRFSVRYFLGTELQNYPVNLKVPSDFVPIKLGGDGNPVPSQAVHAGDPGTSRGEGLWVDYLGQVQGWKVLNGGFLYTWYVDGYLKTKEQVLAWYDEHGWPQDLGVDPLDVREFLSFNKKFGDRLYLVPQIGRMQLYEGSWPIMGQARWAYYSRKDPDFIHRIIDSRKEAQLKILDEISRVKPDLVMGGDDLGQKGRTLVSPAWFDKFLRDPYTEIFTKVHEELGAKVFIHSCGNIVDL
ncbi:MAG: hypothetical protein ACTSU5_02315, partial [Promethearchaeota archaeon]